MKRFLLRGRRASKGMNVDTIIAQSDMVAALCAEEYPVLAQIWDNEEDAIFDEVKHEVA